MRSSYFAYGVGLLAAAPMETVFAAVAGAVIIVLSFAWPKRPGER